jgi:hypothetical protein
VTGRRELACACVGRILAFAGAMAMRKLVLLLALTALLLPSYVIADHDHRATVVTRNGDRVTGNLDGVGKGLVYVRVSQNDQRQLPMGDVLVIDFVGGASGLPDTELSVAARAEHLVVFRNGTSWTGQFISTVAGTDHNDPHQILFRTGNEERRMGLDQVARIYLGNYPFKATAETTTPPQNVPAGAIRVPANAGWVPANMTVRRGDRLVFSVSGQIELSDESGDVAMAAGSPRGRRAAGSPMPNELAGALIARIGNSAAFAIGDQTQPIPMPAAGQLFLGVNDDHVNDNRGEFVVQIQNLGGGSRR